MRVVRALTLLLIAIAIAGCGIPGTAAPTQAPIIIFASPTPALAQGATEAVTPPPPTIATAAAPATAAPALTTTVAPPTAAPVPNAPQLRFSPTTLIAIFRGEIISWNDTRIQADNPGAALPNLPIRVIYRSDASWSTRATTEYFVQVDRWWRDNSGAAYRLGDAARKPLPRGDGASGRFQ